jgi:hypothetical protein
MLLGEAARCTAAAHEEAPMITKSIRLTEAEAASLRRYVDLTGEVEANGLKRAALRGLRDLRMERAVLAYRERGDSYEAAEIAGIGRAQFLWEAADYHVPLLRGPSHLDEEIESLGKDLGSERLVAAAHALAEAKAGDRSRTGAETGKAADAAPETPEGQPTSIAR